MRQKFILFIIIIVIITGCSRVNDPVPAGKGKIIVLMYHRIVEGEATNLYERPVKDLEADFKYFAGNNIKVLNFNDLEKILTSGKMPETNSVVITFDDGDHSWFTLVRPLLLKYKMNATFFLWTQMVDHDSFLSWDEVELMSNYMYSSGERPFLFGSHTSSHLYLLESKAGFSTMNEYNSFLDYELGESRRLIESHTPGEVSVLSLPFGDGAGDADIIAAAKRNGYDFIRTSIWGAIDNTSVNPYIIPSLPILDSSKIDQIRDYLNW